jgi:hypothetical protein
LKTVTYRRRYSAPRYGELEYEHEFNQEFAFLVAGAVVLVTDMPKDARKKLRRAF